MNYSQVTALQEVYNMTTYLAVKQERRGGKSRRNSRKLSAERHRILQALKTARQGAE